MGRPAHTHTQDVHGAYAQYIHIKVMFTLIVVVHTRIVASAAIRPGKA